MDEKYNIGDIVGNTLKKKKWSKCQRVASSKPWRPALLLTYIASTCKEPVKCVYFCKRKYKNMVKNQWIWISALLLTLSKDLNPCDLNIVIFKMGIIMIELRFCNGYKKLSTMPGTWYMLRKYWISTWHLTHTRASQRQKAKYRHLGGEKKPSVWFLVNYESRIENSYIFTPIYICLWNS